METNLFEIFSKQISEIISVSFLFFLDQKFYFLNKHIWQSRPNMAVQDIVALHTTVLNLAVKCYIDRLDYVDKVLEITETIFSNMNLDQ